MEPAVCPETTGLHTGEEVIVPLAQVCGDAVELPKWKYKLWSIIINKLLNVNTTIALLQVVKERKTMLELALLASFNL